MELTKNIGVTYRGSKIEGKVIIEPGGKGIVKEVGENICVVMFPTILGWVDFNISKDDLVMNELSFDQTWEAQYL